MIPIKTDLEKWVIRKMSASSFDRQWPWRLSHSGLPEVFGHKLQFRSFEQAIAYAHRYIKSRA